MINPSHIESNHNVNPSRTESNHNVNPSRTESQSQSCQSKSQSIIAKPISHHHPFCKSCSASPIAIKILINEIINKSQTQKTISSGQPLSNYATVQLSHVRLYIRSNGSNILMCHEIVINFQLRFAGHPL